MSPGIAVLGAGAFGTALAIVQAREGRSVTLWARDPRQAAAMTKTRQNAARLPGFALPSRLQVTADIMRTRDAAIVLLAVPMQALAGFLAEHRAALDGRTLVACCKGIDLATGLGPSGTIRAALPGARPAVLSGPGFADDIAAGLPVAMTLAADDPEPLQQALSTATMRLYRSTDMTGAELGGALKNVIAIGCGIAIGAGLGESARAALMTRGYAEMRRFALARGARAETLSGLSGFGDLALTCTSERSRNFSFGLRLGRAGDRDRGRDPTRTTEGIATARAVAGLARAEGLEMPVTAAVADLLGGKIDLQQAVGRLMARPLTSE